MKFKVGDKVKIVDEVKNLALETPFGTVIIDKNSYPWLKKWLGKVVTIDTAHDGYYTTLEIKGYYLNDELIEGIVEEMTLGEQIKSLRKKKNITQKELAEQLGISTNAMCSIEKGYAWPSGITMEKMCRLLNVELKLIEK